MKLKLPDTYLLAVLYVLIGVLVVVMSETIMRRTKWITEKRTKIELSIIVLIWPLFLTILLIGSIVPLVMMVITKEKKKK